MANLSSRQTYIEDRHLIDFFSEIYDIDFIELFHLSVFPSGSGHFKITSIWKIDDEEVKLEKITDNMPLIDAWNAGMLDLYEEDRDNWFDNWDQVVDVMLSATGINRYIEELTGTL